MPVVLHLIVSLEGGGAERQLCLLTTEQVKNGASVHVACRRGGVYEEKMRNKGVCVHILGNHRNISPLLIIKVIFLIRMIRPSIIQTWLPQMDVVGGIAASCMSVPWILSERTCQDDPNSSCSLAFIYIIRRVLAKLSSAIVANSSGGLANWQRIQGSKARVFLIGNAVDVDKIRGVLTKIHEPTKDRKIRFLVVGRLIESKAIDIIVQSISLIPMNYPIHFLIVGDGPLKCKIEDMIVNAGINGRCSIMSFRKDWWRLLKGARALVSMSRYEGHPNVVLEALVAGCPLILSDIPAHREFLDDNSAFWVPLDDQIALSQAIVSLVSDPELACERATRALNAVENKLSIQSMVAAYESVYKQVMSTK